MIEPIVKRAMLETVTSIGQLTAVELKHLNKAVKSGYLIKALGGPFPKAKTVYALPCHNIQRDREIMVNSMVALAYLDSINARK